MRDGWIDAYRKPMACDPNAVIDIRTCDASVFEAVGADSMNWGCDWGCCVAAYRPATKALGTGDIY